MQLAKMGAAEKINEEEKDEKVPKSKKGRGMC